MAAPDDVTIGELYRTLTRMEQAISALNRRLDGLQFVSLEAYHIQRDAHERRIAILEESDKWRIRSFVVGFVWPVVITIVGILAIGAR